MYDIGRVAVVAPPVVPVQLEDIICSHQSSICLIEGGLAVDMTATPYPVMCAAGGGSDSVSMLRIRARRAANEYELNLNSYWVGGPSSDPSHLHGGLLLPSR